MVVDDTAICGRQGASGIHARVSHYYSDLHLGGKTDTTACSEIIAYSGQSVVRGFPAAAGRRSASVLGRIVLPAAEG